MSDLTRRDVLKWSGWTAGAAGALSLPGAVAAASGSPKGRKWKILFAGAHPDDMEGAAGGTMARYADQGDNVEVVSLYLTRGEAGMKGKTHEEAAAIRSAQAEKACAILKVRPRFCNQVDGTTEVNPARYEEFRKIILEEHPDMVFTWWPINSHRDHRTVFALVYDAWLNTKKGFDLFFCENAGTQLFRPTHYVNISGTLARKREACFTHTWYKDRPDLDFWKNVDVLHRYRGLEAGCTAAEGFVHHSANLQDLPFPPDGKE
jgi:LmbE family N-acetylglucosaminyl deacetylase